MTDALLKELTPTGTLRVALNMSNFLLISTTDQQGAPDGVSPAIARAIADRLGVDVTLIPYKNPGDVADASTRDEWDIGNIAAEPERAKTIAFSPAYCEIQATYLLPPGSAITSPHQVDAPGTRIAVKGRAAYDLWLTDNLKEATLVRADSIDASFELFRDEKLDALAGLRPALIKQQALMPGSVLLDESFTAVQQSIGCQPNKPLASAFLHTFVKEAIASGLVADLIDHYGVTGKLSVAPPVPADS